ncbi:complex I NDUFA9 subunit family protein [Sphingobium sp. SCG-1]|uniref:complex I NDUFA9 subunit family protein n=1 Tax=Sphingobium sp. SCG-1 TaxID=2072936 RepID=UPI000CD6A106|nr:complex I NDUFA9 subunit family protein [Sphingobium sp. SCG-1]AUW60090.1 complex I NDUFA9 subunit family protein [Sphingobium sp. SCG-1]
MENRLVTIFGGGGFLGRYVAQELLARGARIRVAERNPGNALRIKPLGGLGQTQLMSADITKPASVARAVAGADVVVNLVGILSGAFDRVHREGAETVAKAATAAGVGSLVHVSAIGADADSASAYGRSKGQGEAAVRAALPQSIIVRPSIVFGREDQFLNRFAQLIRMAPVVPVISGQTKFQPVYAVDVARAIATLALDASQNGKTFELGGPEVLTMEEINRWVADAIGRKKLFVDVPAPAASALAMLPGGPITSDQLKMLGRDNVVAPGAAGFAELGITPTPIAAVADGWLVKYRRHGRFAGRAEA